MVKSVLVLAAHPDDEVLGCGGTLAKLAIEGVTVNVAFMTDGVSSRDGSMAAKKEEIKVRYAAAEKANDILGVKGISFGNFADNRMDSVDLLDIIKIVEGLIDQHKPDTVFTHHSGDLNIDHRCLHEAVVTACRPQRGHPVKKLLCFEVASSTEWQLPGSASIFEPNWFVDISNTLEIKLAALDAYATEQKEWPHPRSQQGIKHLAGWRGATVGVEAAEAFFLGRLLE